ncbi:GNAT family N-acetyltransferase [Spirillospora sp. CA-255316]
MPALPFPDPPLADDVIALRPWRRPDTPLRFAGFSDPLCRRFSWPLVEPFTEAHVLDRFDEEEHARLRGEELNFAVVDAADRDRVLGGASVYDVDPGEARAAVGFWLASEARGRGVATRTLRLLARWAFDHLAVERLELTCAPDNVASQRVAERCGFVREGVLRSHLRFKGGRRDTMVFSLLPGELR